MKSSKAFLFPSGPPTPNPYPLSPATCNLLVSTQSKVLSISQMILRVVRPSRRQGLRMVFTNGCFDILHAGHVGYLEIARKLGDYLVVGINSDASVRKLKGPTRPINDERNRARVLAALACVDGVVIFNTKRVTPLLQCLKPEIYVKGGDYTEESLDSEERRAIRSFGGEIRILPIWPGHSTSRLIQKIKKMN